MITTELIWHNGKFVKWEDARVHVLTHTLHYGAGAFEGIRVYKTDRGPAIFRLPEHLERLRYSVSVLKLEMPWSATELTAAHIELLCRNKLEQGYIRPLIYIGYGVMGINFKDAPVEEVIACWPWGAYLPHEMVDIKISRFIRVHPKSTYADAKLCGHYVNSVHAVLEVKGTHYHEALFLDGEGNVAEGPGENFFMVKDGTLFTPAKGSILPGITRSTVIELARAKGYGVVEKLIRPDEAMEAEEAFFTGTAAEVTPIRTIDDKVLGQGVVGPITRYLKDTYLDIVYGRREDYFNYLTFVNE